MNKIVITIPDRHLLKLQEIAARLGISVEELLLMGVEELVTQPDTAFHQAVNYVLEKNAELYQRLA